MNSIRITCFILFSFIANFCIAQDYWVDFKDLNDSLKKQAKPVLIFVYTDWCKVCKMQENAVFEDKEILEMLQQEVYALKLNAEGKDDLIFMGRKYAGANQNQYHQLAEFVGLVEGKLSFPTIVYLGNNLELLQVYNRYISKNQIITTIKLLE